MGEKASLNLGKRYWLIMLKGKSYTCTSTKSILGCALIVWSMVYGSSFLSTVEFLQPPLFFLFLFLLFLFILFSVIYHGFCAISIIHVWVRSWELLCPIPHLLEPSTLSCKATCLLFRYHLHINAARELAGQHLMRR